MYVPSAFINSNGILRGQTVNGIVGSGVQVNGINNDQNNALVLRKADLTKYINNQVRIICLLVSSYSLLTLVFLLTQREAR